MSELKEGVKIKIPKTKSYGCSIEASAAVLKAKREGLDHMYIDSVLTDRHDIDEVFGCGCHTGPSDYFLREDIEVYVEPTPPTQADRYNSGKAMFHLLSLEALEPCVRVLEFGAKKYSSIFVSKLEQKLELWNVRTVRETGKLELNSYATVAMKNNCLIAIKSVKNVSGSTSVSTNVKTEGDFWSTIGVEKRNVLQIPSTGRSEEILTTLRSMESQQTSSTDEDKTVASFVERRKPLCTQITTIRLGSLEVCFAVSAITGLVSSMMMLRCLEKLSNTSLSETEFLNSGANNWKKGLVESEVIDSMLRHLKAVLEGEENDPESGLPHIGHVQCNAMFLGHSSLIKNMAGRA